MDDQDRHADPPARLRTLVSWQASKVTTVATRLTAARMPLAARADFAVLAALQEFGAMSQAELGRRLGLDRNDVNGVLNRLQQHRHVDRRADPADRRRNTVSITAGGLVRLEELQARADVVQGELVGALDEKEVSQLQQLLAKVLSGHPMQQA